MSQTKLFDLQQIQVIFGDRLKERVPVARYTAARVGGLADALISVNSKEELIEAARRLWSLEVPFTIIGGGSNILVSDAGVREIVIYNRARRVEFDEDGQPPTVWAESGTNFGVLARQAAARGLAGLEWAVGIPGTVGGAVVGNAGAHGGDIAGSIVMAEILHHKPLDESNHVGLNASVEEWSAERFEFGYRTSKLKRQLRNMVVIAVRLVLQRSASEEVQKRIQDFVAYRHQTQPPGASMGSMFKNPPGDYAGRLIEAAGLKGAHIGGAEISSKHANFFINHGSATAADIRALIELAREKVVDQFGVHLELEIKLVGEW